MRYPTMLLSMFFVAAVSLTACSDATTGDDAGPGPKFTGSAQDSGSTVGDASGGGDAAEGASDATLSDAPDAGADVAVGEDTGNAPNEDTGGPPEDVNGFQYECDPGTVEACLTACGSASQRKCLKEWGPCIPPAEFCGNCADDDCDGLVDEDCPVVDPPCNPEPTCPVAVIAVTVSGDIFPGELLELSGTQSHSAEGAIVTWKWGVQTPDGSASAFDPSDADPSPKYTVDTPGDYLFTLDVWDDQGTQSCVTAQAAVHVSVYPPAAPEAGCADGEREGFLDQDVYTHIAGCAGGWSSPGITPDEIVAKCNHGGGDDGANAEGNGCASPDLCAVGWHVCKGWQEVAANSPSGCAGATPPDAKSKSLFFAMRQPSENGSVCGEWGDGFNDVFGCGNLGSGLGPDKSCGPLDRVLASTQPDKCGFNEAEPPLGPWECVGGPGSDLLEGKTVTKKGCPGGSCSYDGYGVGSQDKGGVLCCRD